MEIRIPKFEESREISDLLIDTITKVNSKDYNLKQIEVWIKGYSLEEIEKKIQSNNRNIFVLIDNNKIVGYLEIYLERSFIDSLYVKNNEIGKGYGKKMLVFAEEFSKQNGAKDLRINSSLTALNFYESQGYKIIEKTFNRNSGIAVPIVRMIKWF